VPRELSKCSAAFKTKLLPSAAVILAPSCSQLLPGAYAALRNDGFSRMDSLRALTILDPILMSFAQDGTRPQRAMRRCRSRLPSSSRSALMGRSELAPRSSSVTAVCPSP
jgi:hypothetical protein